MAKILLVDDSPLLLKIGRALLERDSHTVLTALNGEEAVKAARAEKPQIIFMDAEMPGLDGRAACEAIKKDPATRAIPIFICTGHDLAGEEEKRLRAAGADGVLQKPYRAEEMTALIQRAVK